MSDFDLKKAYSENAEKYKLPSFKELNEEFEIEKIDKDSEILLKVIRKVMIDKIINSLNFLEILMNPVNTPRIYLTGLSNFTVENKKMLDKLYTDFGALSLKSIKLDITYDNDNEAILIKEIFDVWQSSRAPFLKIVEALANPIQNGEKKEKNYFG